MLPRILFAAALIAAAGAARSQTPSNGTVVLRGNTPTAPSVSQPGTGNDQPVPALRSTAGWDATGFDRNYDARFDRNYDTRFDRNYDSGGIDRRSAGGYDTAFDRNFARP